MEITAEQRELITRVCRHATAYFDAWLECKGSPPCSVGDFDSKEEAEAYVEEVWKDISEAEKLAKGEGQVIKIEQIEPGSRTLAVTGIPKKIKDLKNDIRRMKITVGYTGTSSGRKAIVLDNVIIPAIARAFGGENA